MSRELLSVRWEVRVCDSVSGVFDKTMGVWYTKHEALRMMRVMREFGDDGVRYRLFRVMRYRARS